jgi:hypothetical protein
MDAIKQSVENYPHSVNVRLMRHVNLVLILLNAVVGLTASSTEQVLFVHGETQTEITNFEVFALDEYVFRLEIFVKDFYFV